MTNPVNFTQDPVGQKNWNVTVSVTIAGVTKDLGTWDTWEGGNVGADSTKYRPGNMGPQMALGGSPEIDDITLTKYYDKGQDNPNDTWLANGVGGARVSVKKQPLDPDGRVYGSPYNINGTLVGYQHPEHDSNSADFGLVTIVVAPTGQFANA
jgi:hypothetical protein